jgi:hypothetical protein
MVRARDHRPSPAKRGYGREWREKIRPRVLREHGIPRDQWHLYDVDHNPPYDPDVEPDHIKYQLVPRLRPDHSRKTAREDGGFGNPTRGGRVKTSASGRGDRGVQASIDGVSSTIGGSHGGSDA